MLLFNKREIAETLAELDERSKRIEKQAERNMEEIGQLENKIDAIDDQLEQIIGMLKGKWELRNADRDTDTDCQRS